MKIYIITISELYDLGDFPHPPIVKTDRAEAIRALDDLKSSAIEEYRQEFDGMESTEASFSLYPEGYWATSHYDARIDEIEVAGITALTTIPGLPQIIKIDKDSGRKHFDEIVSRIERDLISEATGDRYTYRIDSEIGQVAIAVYVPDRDAALNLARRLNNALESRGDDASWLTGDESMDHVYTR